MTNLSREKVLTLIENMLCDREYGLDVDDALGVILAEINSGTLDTDVKVKYKADTQSLETIKDLNSSIYTQSANYKEDNKDE